MDAASIHARLVAHVKEAGSARRFALRAGVSSRYVLDCLHGTRKPGPAVLAAIGLARRVTVTYDIVPMDGGDA